MPYGQETLCLVLTTPARRMASLEARVICRSRAQGVEQRLGLPEIGRIEALREPAMDRPQESADVVGLALVAPEPAKAAGGPIRVRHAFCYLPPGVEGP
jgi:hypothetical protein